MDMLIYSIGLVLALSTTSTAWQHGFLEEVSQSPSAAICDSVQQYSGYYKLTTGEKNYFYWFFESRNEPSTDPVVLWMTGGPGCSSEVALFGENGPCKVNLLGTDTKRNPYSWNSKANVIYIDQPAGTGFSYGTGQDHNEVQVAADMYDFLQQFMKGHSKYALLDFYAVGESYGGHYVPTVAHLIWKNNNNLPQGAIKINLKGMGVGNGLTDPEIQYKYYPAMAVSTNGHNPAVNNATHVIMEAAVGPCTALIKACNNNTLACLPATDVCNIGLVVPYTFSGMNPYDMREKCKVPPLCYDFSNIGKYLGRAEVRKALGVGNRTWKDCNREVALEFELAGDYLKDYQQQIPDQLAAGIRVLIYAGDQDFICNWLGNQAWTKALEWPHKDSFNNAKLANWTVNGKPAGTLRTSNGFSFLRVYNAGHMVPRDQPENALAMINAFISGKI